MADKNLAKVAIRILILSIVAMSIYTPVLAAGVPPDVQTAAEQGLQRFLNTIPLSELALMGLSSEADVRAATLGAPYEQFALSADAIRTHQPNAKISLSLTRTDAWLFPVTVQGEARTILTVSKVDGRWEAGDIGGTRRAAAFNTATASLTRVLQQQSLKATDSVQFVRVFEINGEFLLVTSGKNEFFMPLSTEMASQFNWPAYGLVSPEEVVTSLRTQIRQQPMEAEPSLGGGGGSPGVSPKPDRSMFSTLASLWEKVARWLRWNQE